jgi:hypothetical protein
MGGNGISGGTGAIFIAEGGAVDSDIKNGLVTNTFNTNRAGDEFCGPSSICASLLAIVLGKFNASQQSNSVELEWQTISEENFDYFSIERSEDGDIFYEISSVPGHGNSNDPIDYSFVDENPLFGTSFYRLNAIDYDGTYEKFQTLSVEFIPDDLQVSIYPNPGNSDNMTLRLGSPSEAKLKTISIIYT